MANVSKKRRVLAILLPSVGGGILLIALLVASYFLLFNVKRDGFHYKWVRGGYTVLAYEGSETHLSVPDTLNRRPVIRIEERALAGHSSFVSVTVPDTVEEMGFAMLEGCTQLETLTLPFVGDTREEAEYTHIGYLFGTEDRRENDELVPHTLSAVTVTGGKLGASALAGLRGLKTATVGDGVTALGGSVFEGCVMLETVTLGSGITAIGDASFAYCVNLTSIEIPATVSKLERSLFEGCVKLETVTLHEGLAAIGSYTFKNCAAIAEITLPKTLVSIDTCAFYNCSNLNDLVLPESVSRIGALAFQGCNRMRNVEIEGESKWRMSGSDSVIYPTNGRTVSYYLRYEYCAETWRRVQ